MGCPKQIPWLLTCQPTFTFRTTITANYTNTCVFLSQQTSTVSSVVGPTDVHNQDVFVRKLGCNDVAQLRAHFGKVGPRFRMLNLPRSNTEHSTFHTLGCHRCSVRAWCLGKEVFIQTTDSLAIARTRKTDLEHPHHHVTHQQKTRCIIDHEALKQQ